MKVESIINAFIEGKVIVKTQKKCKTKWNRLKKNFRSIKKKYIKKADTAIALGSRKVLSLATPIVNNKILFVTTRGSYNCNPKGIADEIIRQNLPWELVWVARKENLNDLEQFPANVKIVLRDSAEFYKEASSAKIWIDNSVNLSYMHALKKRKQVLIETWHGSLGLKRFDTNNDQVWVSKATKCGKRTKYCISNSDFETELFVNSFWSNADILLYGHARNDILFAGKDYLMELNERIRTKYGISMNAKLALYAPTFRDNMDIKPYDIDYESLQLALEERFGGEWLIMNRLHFQIRKLKMRYPECVVDFTDYNDIQDLLAIADIGITDYSSWICDFVLTRRPGFIFAVDLNQYYDERGFYYPLEETPFPIAESNAQLINNILQFDNEKYIYRVEEFLIDKGCVDDGKASERIVNKLKEIINS